MQFPTHRESLPKVVKQTTPILLFFQVPLRGTDGCVPRGQTTTREFHA